MPEMRFTAKVTSPWPPAHLTQMAKPVLPPLAVDDASESSWAAMGHGHLDERARRGWQEH